MRLGRVPLQVLAYVAVATYSSILAQPALAYVALMSGQKAKPLHGSFNRVPVLHSNQPEIVKGPGILVTTSPGTAIAAESNRPLRNATYTFNGDFGVHMHHKYYPADSKKLGGRKQRGLLTLGLIAINPGDQPVTLKFSSGSVKNSFEAPYLPNNLMGVKPLGKRPWNTGPGDATAVQMLREELDRKLRASIVIPARSKRVVISTDLPARGIANGLLQGRSDGPFQLAVVAAEDNRNEQALLAVLRQGRLAPGRIYLNQIREIQTGKVFSRVAGVAIGDRYNASVDHNLNQGPLHVPLTSTSRHHFGTGDVQVNPLTSRMIDSALNNVGTYGVRYDVTMNLKGRGAHQLVLSHPVVSGKKQFTAFRGSIRIQQGDAVEEVHVGLRAGESLALTDLRLTPGRSQPVNVSLVYPADATPGHLLSVVPAQQLAMLHQQQKQQKATQVKLAAQKTDRKVVPNQAPPAAIKPVNKSATKKPKPLSPPPPLPAIVPLPSPSYTDAIRSQQQWLRQLQGR